jgi:hypothetical protein
MVSFALLLLYLWGKGPWYSFKKTRVQKQAVEQVQPEKIETRLQKFQSSIYKWTTTLDFK